MDTNNKTDIQELKSGCSVILPVYNEDRYVSYILNFLEMYDRANEVIIINDGSTDNSHKIIQDFIERSQTSKFKYINLPVNKGKAYAVQQGVCEAQFDKIVFSDSDILNIDEGCFDVLIDNLNDRIRMVILDSSYFRRYPFSIGGITTLWSGQRAMYTTDIRQLDLASVYNYQLESMMNDEYIKRGWRITSKFRFGAESPLHFEKQKGTLSGFKYYLYYFKEIFGKFPPHKLLIQRLYIPVQGIEWAFFMYLPKPLKVILAPVTWIVETMYSVLQYIASNLYYIRKKII